MRTRNALVSNSSSSSFIIRGIKVDVRDFCKFIGLNEIDKEKDDIDQIRKFLVTEFQVKDMELVPFKNYFQFEEPYEDMIIGLKAKVSFNDGEIVEMKPTDLVDTDVKLRLVKLGYENPPLSTFVQYVSNDNC